jgi:hypothetical protein
MATVQPVPYSLPSCPKCGYSCGSTTWRGPRYRRTADASTHGRRAEVGQLEYTCEGCGFVHVQPTLDEGRE